MFTYKKLIVLILAVALVSPFSVSAKTKAGTKPGSFFYFFDKAFEKADLFFTFNPEKKAKKALENADERLAEAEESANENKPKAVAVAMENYQENISLAETEAKAIKDETKTKTLLSTIASSTAKHQEILTEVLNKVPEEAKEAIEKAIETSKKVQEEAMKETEDIEKGVSEITQEPEEIKNEEEQTKSNDDKEDNKKNESKKDEQKKEIEKLKKKVETLKQKQSTPQPVPKQSTPTTQNSQEQNKLEEVQRNAEEVTKQLIMENLQKEQEETKIKAEQERLREAQRLADHWATKERQKELEKQQQLENQRLAEEKAKVVALPSRDVIPPMISQIRAHISQDTKNYVIEWVTNEPTLGKIGVGGIMSCSINGCEDSYSGLGEFEQNESYSLDHQIIIDRDLEPATEYKYYIYATDKAGNETSFFGGKIVTEPLVPLPELKGQYNADLVLTKGSGPYTVTGDVFINKKLQIEPGVKIKFNGAYKLVVNRTFGEIRVSGTKSEPVLFEFDQSSDSSNNGIYIRSSNNNVIDNAIVELASTRAISIDSEQNGTRANAVISNSAIRNNPVGIWVNNSTAKITNSIITKNRTGVQSVFNSRVEISQSDISDNSHIALSFETGSVPQLKFNNIFNNNDIMRIHAHPDLKVAVLSQNNISLEKNKGNIYFGSESTSEPWSSQKGEMNAQNNWWGTTDIAVIAQRIKEYNDTSFDYTPIATSEITEAGVK